MTKKEFQEYVNAEIFKERKPTSFIGKLRVKYAQPNTNCMYMCRTMWYLYQRGNRLVAKMIYLRILHKYGCCISPSAKIGKGFYIEHPVGIVIGSCEAGENLTIYQNSTIGTRYKYDESKGLTPKIGNDVVLCANSLVLGSITICDNCLIGAGAVVLHNLATPGTYVGVPAHQVAKKN